jgi:hypothetical protein
MNKDAFYREAMPMLKAAATELRPKVEDVRLALERSEVGGIFLGAFFSVSRANTDLLQLIIHFQIVDGLEVVDAQVIWGHDSLYVEADEPVQGYVAATSENLQHVLAKLPHLIAIFKAAVLRGRPADA